MITNLSLKKLLFLDIETVPLQPGFSALSPLMQELWSEKFTKIEPDSSDPAAGFVQRAGIYAEFGKIVCISAGYFHPKTEKETFRIKSYYGEDEAILLTSFFEAVRQFSCVVPDFLFCGHNIREFDIPYICRRGVINGLTLPVPLQLYGKKPWEVPLLDTLRLWRFGDHKHYTSLKLLAGILNIPTPKDDIDGSQVGNVYWQENDLQRIATYCQKDVLTVMQLLRRFKQLPLLEKENIEMIP